jgi:hypothetical protein
MNYNWDDNIINILDRIRWNAIALNKKHSQQYNAYLKLSRLFDLPIIICSVFSASFQTLGTIPPDYVSIITTAISMFITILSSTKLYFNLSSNINNEIDLSKSYYILSITIFKMVSLKPLDSNPRLFLDECFSEYTKLIEQSSILIKDIKKDLLNISNLIITFDDNSTINSSNSSNNIIISEFNNI